MKSSPGKDLQECRQTETGVENPANKRADADATPTLRNHWVCLFLPLPGFALPLDCLDVVTGVFVPRPSWSGRLFVQSRVHQSPLQTHLFLQERLLFFHREAGA